MQLIALWYDMLMDKFDKILQFFYNENIKHFWEGFKMI